MAEQILTQVEVDALLRGLSTGAIKTEAGKFEEKYEEFLFKWEVPWSLNVFQLLPFRGQGVLAVDPSLVFIIVDSYFGGDGRFHTRIEGRGFTNVEQAGVKKGGGT